MFQILCPVKRYPNLVELSSLDELQIALTPNPDGVRTFKRWNKEQTISLYIFIKAR